ncbi:hypothetical protein F4678DRAFT_442958 [Xylaria arbuscula]|nr:hypothetical protein F4678DRAFT_442958 [Xylaria arbuscula]
MLRQLLGWCRSPPRILTSSLIRPSQPQPRFLLQRHFFSRSGIPRHSPRTNQHGQNGNRARHLYAHIHCTILVSIMGIVLTEADDWWKWRRAAIHIVIDIMNEEDPNSRWKKVWALSEWLLQKFSGVEHIDYPDVDFREKAWGIPSGMEARLMTAPDPDVEGGTLVLFVGMMMDAQEDTYVVEDGYERFHNFNLVAPAIETFAREKLETWPRVRGAVLLIEQDGWSSVYWDGRRWINVIFLEWQTRESMAHIIDEL